jgi:MEMO1 family protein
MIHFSLRLLYMYHKNEVERDFLKRTAMSELRNEERVCDRGFSSQVSGIFYPADSNRLRQEVDRFLGQGASVASRFTEQDVVGILCPHAGIQFSGAVAGKAFGALRGGPCSLVVILALHHRKGVEKVSLLNRSFWHTPLGPVRIDQDAVQGLLKLNSDVFELNEDAFVGEHSLEVQLPFVQAVFPNVPVLPLTVGPMSPLQLRNAAVSMWEMFSAAGDVRFVVSSDLSHFFSADEGLIHDERSLALLESCDVESWMQHASQPAKGMCGFYPMLMFQYFFAMYSSSIRRVSRIARANSGQVNGDRSRVVGYGAMAFSVLGGVRTELWNSSASGADEFRNEDRITLLSCARNAIARELQMSTPVFETPTSPSLVKKGAAFVTLKKAGQLRGCVGHVSAQMPLFRCVMSVAVLAATRDMRFSPVTVEELDDIELEISVLTPPVPIAPEDVVIGRDGLTVRLGNRLGLLLPQVAVEWGWDRETFLQQVCRKADLPPDSWMNPDTELCAFRAMVVSEKDL